MLIQIVVLFLLLAIFTISAYLMMSKMLKLWVRILTIVSVSGIATLYIRTGFGRYFTTIDESYYMSLLGDPLWYRTSIVSGYITPFSLHLVYSVFSDVIGVIVGYSFVMVILYTLILFLLYRKSGMSKDHTLLAILLLFITPLYWWSVVQIRPQQVGLLVGLLLAVLVVTGRPTFRFSVFVLMLHILLVFAHVLSFILYSAVFVVYLALLMLLRNNSQENEKKYIIVAVSITVSWIVFIVFPYSSNLLNNLAWITNNVLNTHMSVMRFYFISTFAIGMSLTLVYRVVVYLRNHIMINRGLPKSPVLRFVNMWVEVSHWRYIPWALAGIVILAIFYLQFELGARIYTRVYNDSIVAVVFFQMGNLFFALFFLRGILMKLRENTITNFDILSVAWIPIATILLFISFFMPKGGSVWGFHNWLIRTLQYFVIFASPIAAYPIMNDILSANVIKMKSVLSLLLGILIMISILNTARVPGVYTYDTVWTQELIDICQDAPNPAVYTPRASSSVYYKFSIDNLLKICNGGIKNINTESMDYLILSSDEFYVSLPDYRPISLGTFGESLQSAGGLPWIVIGGNKKLQGYYLSLLGNAVIMPIEQYGDCPLERNKIGYPTILIGGSAVNPCTLRLEEEHVVSVYIDSSSVSTPRKIYSISHSDNWWNTKEGLFVIQAIEYHNIPILIIEGTNVDATLAAVYYFSEEVYPELRSKYRTAGYIVGKWEERDNTVLSVVKLVPQDINGFSFGDKIIILEVGSVVDS